MDNYLALRRDINSLGCDNEQLNSAAHQVYVNLREQKRYFEISYHFSQELNLVYILARKTAADSQSVYVPVSAFQTLEFGQIRKVQTTLSLERERPKSIFLVIVDSSGTILYYRMTESFPDFSTSEKREMESSSDSIPSLTGS